MKPRDLGGSGSNPSFLFIFSFFSIFSNLGCKFGMKLNLPTFLLKIFFHPFEIFHPNFGVFNPFR